MAAQNSLIDLLTDEVKDLYSAEKQLLKAIPKMAKGSNDPALQGAFQQHLKETESQVDRLESISSLLEIKPGGKKCAGMEGIINEGSEVLQEDGDPLILDLGIIGAGSRVEHYEIAGYRTAIELARKVGSKEVVNLLDQTLQEELEADKKLRAIAQATLKKL